MEQERDERALETEEKVVNTLPELATVSKTLDKDTKREAGVVLDDENNENIDNYFKENDYKEKISEQNKTEKEECSDSDSNKINIKGSIEKKVFELDDNDQIKMVSNTKLLVNGNKEKINEDISLNNISISKTIERPDDEIIETIEVDETVVETPFEKTTFESISKTENHTNEPTTKSSETDKITIQDLETNKITSTEMVTTKKEVTEISPDQTLIETLEFKGNKDEVSKKMNIRSVDIKETLENDTKDQKNIDSITKHEATTETPVDKTTVTTIVSDNSTINKVISTDSDKEDLMIAQNQNENSSDKSNINVITATEIREIKSQLEDNDDEDSETPTPATPEGEEDLLMTISKMAPELVPVISDLKQESDKLDPIKRTWNDLKLRKNLEHSTTTETDRDIEVDKIEEENLLQQAVDSIRAAMIEEVEGVEDKANQKLEQEERNVLISSEQTLIQPTSSSPSSIVADVVESMITPGFNNNVVLAMNTCFWLLFTSLIFLAVVTDFNYMVILNLGISITLYIAMYWFVLITRAAQLEEAATIAKKEN